MTDDESSDAETASFNDDCDGMDSGKTISFRFGTCSIVASGSPSDSYHPNVLLLTRHLSSLDRIIHTTLALLPSALAACVKRIVPEWTLPEKIVLKKQKKGWDEEFDTEKATYKKLKHLQGRVIPELFGQVVYQGVRALVFSYVGEANMARPQGTILDSTTGEELTPAEFREMATQALGTLFENGISQDDLKLGNFHRMDEAGRRKIMVLDLEHVTEVPKEEKDERTNIAVDWLTRRYREHVKCMRYDELLPPAPEPDLPHAIVPAERVVLPKQTWAQPATGLVGLPPVAPRTTEVLGPQSTGFAVARPMPVRNYDDHDSE